MKYDNVLDLEVTKDITIAQKHIRAGFSVLDLRTERLNDGTEKIVYVLLKIGNESKKK